MNKCFSYFSPVSLKLGGILECKFLKNGKFLNWIVCHCTRCLVVLVGGVYLYGTYRSRSRNTVSVFFDLCILFSLHDALLHLISICLMHSDLAQT